MTEFDYDDLQKEETMYREAYRRIRARQSVMLPSDYLDPAALQRRNGPCRTYRLSRPMTGTEFEDMPQDLQRAYLHRLRIRGGSEADVENMLGAEPGGLRKYRIRFDKPDVELWERFMQSCVKEV